MGDALLAQDGREQEAVEMFQKAYGILETCDDPEGLSWTLCKLGKAFTRIEARDDAITALEESSRLQHPLNKRGSHTQASYFSQESIKLWREDDPSKPSIYLDLGIYILTWRRITIFLTTWRKPRLCSRNTWTRQWMQGHHIAKHAINLVRRMKP